MRMLGRIPVNVQMKACGQFQILCTGTWKPAEVKGIVQPKMKIVICITYSPLCCFDAVCPPQKEILLNIVLHMLVYIMAVKDDQHQAFFKRCKNITERSHAVFCGYTIGFGKKQIEI